MMKRTALIFCSVLLTVVACSPSAPLTPVETATLNSTLTRTPTSALTQTATFTDPPTSTLTQPPPSETITATSIPPSTEEEPPPPPPAPTDTATPTLTAPPEVTDTPTPTLACEHETAFAFLSVSTETLQVGDTVTVTVTLKNEGCVNLGLPQYRLRIQPDGPDPIFSPENPEPVVHYLSVIPGESDSQEFVLTAVASGGATLSGSASYEVHLGYPGPAYWGYAATAPLSLVVAP